MNQVGLDFYQILKYNKIFGMLITLRHWLCCGWVGLRADLGQPSDLVSIDLRVDDIYLR